MIEVEVEVALKPHRDRGGFASREKGSATTLFWGSLVALV